jgi:putative ATPase
MLEGGEDVMFIARRLVIFASEDIGNADPRALEVAINVMKAAEFIGMPEARISLGQGVTYLACAPKSNASYQGIEMALEEVRNSGNLEIPLQIRNAPTKFMKGLGYGGGYQYAHDSEQGLTNMKCLPKEIENKVFYEPKEIGFEKQIKERLEWIKNSVRNNGKL